MRLEKWNAILLVTAVLAVAAGGPWFVAQLRSLPRHETLAARANQRIVTLEVGGMRCQSCAAAVQGSLAGLSGVSQVDVRVPQQRAYVVCDRTVADSSLTAAVHRAGPGFLAAIVAQ